MANIIDYLKWRGDLTFDIEPFNEIDNLILSELSYVPYEGLVPSYPKGEKVPLKSVCHEFYKINDYETVFKTVKHSDFSQILMKYVVESERFKDVLVSDFVNEIEEEIGSQFAAVTFYLPDNSAFVSFRGTDHTIVGWQEDFNMAYLDAVPGQLKAVKYLETILSRNSAVRVGGHSKGGNLSVYSAAFSDKKYSDRILEVFSNDGPGFREHVFNSDEIKRILPKVTSIIPKDSIVGTLLENAYHTIICDSNAYGLEQHDLFSWQVSGKKLVTVESIGNWSNIFSSTLKEWLSEISDADRKDFVMLVFSSVYELTGSTVDSFPDIKILKKKMEGHLSDFPKEKQKKFKELFQRLAKNCSKELWNNYKFW